MASIFSIIFPVFGLILAGFLFRRLNILGPAAATELNRFVVWLALPAMLFQIMAKADWHSLYQPAFTATVMIAGLGLFAIVVWLQFLRGRSLADASTDGMAAAYSNAGYMGFPLTFLLIGDASLVPTTITTMFVVCIMFGVAIAVIEWARQRSSGQSSFLRVLPRIAWSLLKNPLIASPLAGIALASTGWQLPASGDQFLAMLASAASPCALVSLGLFLASSTKHQAREPHSGASSVTANHFTSQAWMLTIAKLIVMPLMTWLLARWVFHLPDQLVQMAVLLMALPTGTGPYMLAEMYGLDGTITAKTVLFSTVASVLTIALLLHWFAA